MKKEQTEIALKPTPNPPKKRRIRRSPKVLKAKSNQAATKSHTIGRKKVPLLIKQRNTYLNNQPRIFAAYFEIYSLSLMMMYKRISLDVKKGSKKSKSPVQVIKPEKITSFINDNHPSIEEIERLAVNIYQREYLREHVSGSFVFGLCQLRKKAKGDNFQGWLVINQNELKSLYIISLLLIGVTQRTRFYQWQIDSLNPSSDKQTIPSIYEEIVESLLDQTESHSKLLDPTILSYLNKQRDSIIDLIHQSILQQKSQDLEQREKGFRIKWIQPQTQDCSLKHPQFVNKAKKIPLQKTQQFSAEKKQYCFADHSSQVQYQRIGDFLNLEDTNTIEKQHPQLYEDSVMDYDFINSESFQINDNPKPTDLRSQNTQQLIECAPYGINLKLAKKFFGIGAKKRNRKQQQKRKQQKLRLKQTMEAHKMLESSLNSQSQPAGEKQIFMDNSTQNFCTSVQRSEPQESMSQRVQNTQHSPAPQKKPYHEVLHDHKELDHMYNELNQNEMAIARSIVNHIWYSLLTNKVHLNNKSQQNSSKQKTTQNILIK